MEKAPRPDGYIGLFYKTCWPVVKADLLQALPKKEEATTAADFRLSSLMHSVVTILGEVLVNRLVPHLNSLVSHSQSAFIKGRRIQYNFQYIQEAIRHSHKSMSPMFCLKLDIAKAFDFVRWDYLLEVMQKLGFR